MKHHNRFMAHGKAAPEMSLVAIQTASNEALEWLCALSLGGKFKESNGTWKMIFPGKSNSDWIRFTEAPLVATHRIDKQVAILCQCLFNSISRRRSVPDAKPDERWESTIMEQGKVIFSASGPTDLISDIKCWLMKSVGSCAMVPSCFAAAGNAPESTSAPDEPSKPHPACKPDTLVNGGALQLALNALKRGTPVQQEIAAELEKTVAAPSAATATIPPKIHHRLADRLGRDVDIEEIYKIAHGID